MLTPLLSSACKPVGESPKTDSRARIETPAPPRVVESRKTDRPSPVKKAKPPMSVASLVFDVRTHIWGWRSKGVGFEEQTMQEVKARPGDSIGHQSFGTDAPPFTLLEIIDKDHARVRIASDLILIQEHQRRGSESSGDIVLAVGESLRAHTQSCDAGATYTLRITDLKSVPPVTADSSDIIAALSDCADVIKDKRGSIQVVGPPGVGRHGLDFDQAVQRWQNLDETFWQSLAKLNNLRCLDLSGSNVTDDDLRYVEHLPRLVCLDLSGTKITDEGMKHLASLQRLDTIGLWDTSISDEGVKSLLKLSHLESLRYEKSKITPEALWALQLASPHFRADDGHDKPWGQLVKSGSTIGPRQLIHESGDRNDRILQLLILGCTLTENGTDSTWLASVPVPREKMTVGFCTTNSQIRRAIGLLAQIGNVVAVNMHDAYGNPGAHWIDDETISALGELRDLRELGLDACGLTEAGWLHVAKLTKLKKLHLGSANASREMVGTLQKALPGCAMDRNGWPCQ